MKKNIFIIILSFMTFFINANNETKFNGWKAMEYLSLQCSFGPRVPGTDSHKQCFDWIKAEIDKTGLQTKVMSHNAYSNLIKKQIPLKNLFAVFNPSAKNRMLFSAHWDTRPISEKDPNPNFYNTPILGANDGASGVAVLIELANYLSKSDSIKKMLSDADYGVILAFYDGEDLGSFQYPDDWCLGSKAFAENIPDDLKFNFGVNIDMIGDKDLEIFMEVGSNNNYPELTKDFWDVGTRLYPKIFIPETKHNIVDDHTSFLKLKIPYINVIDFTYTYWHTQQDTPDKCSPQSLQTIGDTIVTFMATKVKNNKKKLEN